MWRCDECLIGALADAGHLVKLSDIAKMLGFVHPKEATLEQVRESIEALLETRRFYMVRTGQVRVAELTDAEIMERVGDL